MYTSLMRRTGTAAAFVVLGLAAAAAQGLPADTRAKAEQVLARYIALEHAFDPAIADLYADDAVIRTKRTYPTGEVRDLTISATDYKALIRKTVPLAKTRGDTSRYSGCTYAADGARVRIGCTRYSELKGYSSPISLLVGPGPGVAWLIFEELSESRA
jgi:hypothetical protein